MSWLTDPSEDIFSEALSAWKAKILRWWNILLGKSVPVPEPEPLAHPESETIVEFVTTDTWMESKNILERHPELLSPLTDSMIWMLKVGQSDKVKFALKEHRDLLIRCRTVGIQQAFDEKIRSAPPGRKVISKFE